MMQDEDKFEEEFSNWAKTVLCLKNTRDSSIGFIKHKMNPFVDELVQMHGANEESHFKELLIKVAVNGEVKKTMSNSNKSKHTWTLYDNRCTICVNIFQKILDNFYDSCSCERWARHASKQTIDPSNYWWIISKLYISHTCVVEAALEPESVEPLAVFSLISRCKLFHEKLIWFDVAQVIQCSHEIIQSVDNRLSEDKKDKYCSEMKTFIEKVTVDNSTAEVLQSFEEVENTTVALFTEDGEIHELASEALKLQEESLNVDFKLPKTVQTTMKSLTMLTIERKRIEFKLDMKYRNLLENKETELQKKIDALKRDLQHETEKNKRLENNFTELNSNFQIENELKSLKQEKSKQDREISSLRYTMQKKIEELQRKNCKQDDRMSSFKSTIENEVRDLKQGKSEQDSYISSLKSTVQNKFDELQKEKSKQDNEMSTLKSTIMNELKDFKQEKSKQDSEICSLKNTVDDEIKKLQQENSKQDDDVSTLKSTVQNKFDELRKEKSKQDNEMSTLKSTIMNELKDFKQEKRKQDSEIYFLKNTVDDEIKKLQQENSKQDDDMSTLKSTVQNKFDELQKEQIKQDNKMSTFRNTDHQIQISKLKKENGALRLERKTPKEQINAAKTSKKEKVKSKKKVQILDSVHTHTSSKFATALMAVLTNYSFDRLLNAEGLENDIPLIVVCLLSSRLKPDVEQALSNVTYSAKCVVLIVHTGGESNLPVISSSIKLSGLARNVKCIDIGFDVDGGIYNCTNNGIARLRLSEYIDTFPLL